MGFNFGVRLEQKVFVKFYLMVQVIFVALVQIDILYQVYLLSYTLLALAISVLIQYVIYLLVSLRALYEICVLLLVLLNCSSDFVLRYCALYLLSLLVEILL